jgi:hypothetical protein
MKETKNTRRMQTRNDKITRSKRGVEKAHWKHQGCSVGHENFLFPTIKNIQMFRVECIGYNVNWTIQSSHFCFILGLLEGFGARVASNFLGFLCLFYAPIMFYKFPKLFPNLFPIDPHFYTITFAKNPRNHKKTLDFFFLLVAV